MLVQRQNLLDEALSNLAPEQRKALMAKAAEKKLDIDEEAKKAQLRYHASSADMENTIKQVRDLEESTKSDYSMHAEYSTASGHTRVDIRKSGNLAVIIIVIVIGIVLLLVFA